ncbi:hypothetical protein SynMINOS11_00339 [Synechococcus sp. Minos11]|nr:hypothetical protein SynMINOS11_00339 [Synechococcus sp. Minos11]
MRVLRDAFFIPVEALGVRSLGVMDPGLAAHGAGMAMAGPRIQASARKVA